MKLSERLQEALNKQIRLEIESAYKYDGMRLYFKDLGSPGAEHWLKLQAHEELKHAEDFTDIILELDGELAPLGALEEQPVKYESFLDVFEQGLEHEKLISRSILDILEIAIEEKNYAAENFLRTYVDEQVEEEDTFRGVIDLIKLADKDKAALFKVDSILAKRDH